MSIHCKYAGLTPTGLAAALPVMSDMVRNSTHPSCGPSGPSYVTWFTEAPPTRHKYRNAVHDYATTHSDPHQLQPPAPPVLNSVSCTRSADANQVTLCYSPAAWTHSLSDSNVVTRSSIEEGMHCQPINSRHLELMVGTAKCQPLIGH